MPFQFKLRSIALATLLLHAGTGAIAAETKLAVGNERPEDVATLEAVVVTGTRSEREVDLISKPITVIDREQIEVRSPRNVQELLEEVPGVSLSRAGGLDGQIVMRGFNSNDSRAVLYIDGDRFRGRNTLEYTLLDPNQIERIEVLRGPASALYGPDALVGIINVITRRAKGDPEGPWRIAPRLQALNYNSVNQLRGGRGELEILGYGVDMLLGVNGRDAEDFDSGDGKVPNSDFKTLSADLRLGYSLLPGHRIELIGKYADVETGRAGGIGGAPGSPLVDLREDPIREHFGKLSYTANLSEFWLKHIESSFYARKIFTRIITDNRTVANRLTHSDNFVDGPLIVGGKLQGVVPWGQSVLTAGADFFHEMRKGTEVATVTTNFNPDGTLKSVSTSPRAQNVPDATQTDIGFFVHNDWDPSPQWTISVGGRVDYIRTTSETSPIPDPKLQAAFERAQGNTETPLTGSLGVIFRPWDILHFTGNVSRAFRVPATFESFGSSRQGAGFLVPNPDLQSEEGVTYEVGARMRLASLNANLTVFHSDYKNLIVRRPVTFLGLPSTQRQNAGEAEIDGLEFDATWAFADRWKAFANVAYLRGTDTITDKPLAYIPPLNGLVGLRYTFHNGFYVEGVGKWSLGKDRIDPAQERKTDGFAVTNLYAGIDLKKAMPNLPGYRLSIGIENLFDRAYRQPTTVEDVRFPVSNTNPLLEPGRSVFITLTSQF